MYSTDICPELLVMQPALVVLLCLYHVCLPLSLPSLYLAYRLVSKRFLGSVFNQHIAVMLIISGNLT